jgi:hypothetical protein
LLKKSNRIGDAAALFVVPSSSLRFLAFLLGRLLVV